MSNSELLDQAKAALGIDSDYALAKAFDMNNSIISSIRKGERQPDIYTATRLALAIGRDPFELLVEIEAAHARRQQQRDWWRGFLSSALRSGATNGNDCASFTPSLSDEGKRGSEHTRRIM